MKKQDLVKKLVEASNTSTVQVERMLEKLSTTIGDVMAEGGEFTYPNLGKFYLRRTPARQANDPRNPGHRLDVAAANKVVFRAAKALRDRAPPLA